MSKLLMSLPMKVLGKYMREQPLGEVYVYIEDGEIWRKEVIYVEGYKFYRFIINQGYKNAFETFYSDNEEELKSAVKRKLKRLQILYRGSNDSA